MLPTLRAGRRTIAATLLLLPWGVTFACSCMSPGVQLMRTAQSELAEADVVFLGQAEGVQRESVEDGVLLETTEFYVLESWKGEDASRITTRIETGFGRCGIEFEAGRKYLVFGFRNDDGTVTSSICGPSGPIEDVSEQLTILRTQQEEVEDAID